MPKTHFEERTESIGHVNYPDHIFYSIWNFWLYVSVELQRFRSFFRLPKVLRESLTESWFYIQMKQNTMSIPETHCIVNHIWIPCLFSTWFSSSPSKHCIDSFKNLTPNLQLETSLKTIVSPEKKNVKFKGN